MKLKQKKSKKPLLITVGVVALLVIGACIYIFGFNGSIFGWQFRKESTTNLNPPSKEESQAGQQTKEASVEAAQGKPSTGDDTPTSDSGMLSVEFSAVNQNQGTLQVRLMIQEVLADGTCTLTLTQDSHAVTKEAALYPTANISTCQGFDIPVSELSAGMWNIAIDIASGSKKGQATTTIQIN